MARRVIGVEPSSGALPLPVQPTYVFEQHMLTRI